MFYYQSPLNNELMEAEGDSYIAIRLAQTYFFHRLN